MKVLWLTRCSPSFLGNKGGYNGYGWVSSLAKEMSTRVDLAVAFVSNSVQSESKNLPPIEHEGVKYYPISNPFDKSRFSRVLKLVKGNAREQEWIVGEMIKVVNDFRPDIIEVFGTEHPYGMVTAHTSVPVVLHLQGILAECADHYLPPGMSAFQYQLSAGSLAGFLGKYYYMKDMRRRVQAERKIFELVENYIGRTAWDRSLVSRLSPSASYYELDEILREPFYGNAGKWQGLSTVTNRSADKSVTIVTTISEAPFKGMDVVLRTAEILKRKFSGEFRWIVCGNVNAPLFEKFTGIKCKDVNVEMAGVVTAASLAELLISASVYVHPSYMENSPNSVCEAQMVGVPVVASRIGGIPSIVEDGVTGLLSEPGDCESFAEKILSILTNDSLSRNLSSASIKRSLVRHDRNAIADRLLGIYKDFLKK